MNTEFIQQTYEINKQTMQTVFNLWILQLSDKFEVLSQRSYPGLPSLSKLFRSDGECSPNCVSE